MTKDNYLASPLKPAAALILSRKGKIWLGQRGNSRFLPGFSVFPGGACERGESPMDAARRETEEETGLKLPSNAELMPFSRAVTPAYSTYRFDAMIYHLELEGADNPVPDGKELVRGEWLSAKEILDRRCSGVLQLAPPTYRQVVQWAECSQSQNRPTVEAAFAEPPESNQQVLPFAPGLTLVPLRTRAMPPATWTNTAILGTENLYILDPGGPGQKVLTEELQRLTDKGAQLAGVILSHHHPDHIDGYHQLGLSHLPLYCHPLTAALLPDDFPPTQALNDLEVLKIEPGLSLICHFTPGHAPGHLAFEIPQRKALLAGDMISSLSSIVIPPDNGSLPEYLDSLNRLQKLDCHLVIPAHGPPFGMGSDPFGQALAHREKRERQILSVLSKNPSSVESIVETLYPKLDGRLVRAALANVSHHLKKLQTEGRVEKAHCAWQLRGNP